ncbi:hypothetical protein [Mycoplasma sp. 5370]
MKSKVLTSLWSKNLIFKKKKSFFNVNIIKSNKIIEMFSESNINIYIPKEKNYFSFKENVFCSLDNAIIKIRNKENIIKLFLVDKTIIKNDKNSKTLEVIVFNYIKQLFSIKNDKIKLKEIKIKYKQAKKKYKKVFRQSKVGMDINDILTKYKVVEEYEILKIMKGSKIYFKDEKTK